MPATGPVAPLIAPRGSVPASKIGIGMPFYYNTWTGPGCTQVLVSGCTRTADHQPYSQLITSNKIQYHAYDPYYGSNYLSIPRLNEFDSYNGVEFIHNMIPLA